MSTWLTPVLIGLAPQAPGYGGTPSCFHGNNLLAAKIMIVSSSCLGDTGPCLV